LFLVLCHFLVIVDAQFVSVVDCGRMTEGSLVVQFAVCHELPLLLIGSVSSLVAAIIFCLLSAPLVLRPLVRADSSLMHPARIQNPFNMSVLETSTFSKFFGQSVFLFAVHAVVRRESV
jgi:hypothetical protein